MLIVLICSRRLEQGRNSIKVHRSLVRLELRHNNIFMISIYFLIQTRINTPMFTFKTSKFHVYDQTFGILQQVNITNITCCSRYIKTKLINPYKDVVPLVTKNPAIFFISISQVGKSIIGI